MRTEDEVRMRQRSNRREWSRRVSEWRRSGKTSKEYAAETGVNPSTLLWWSTKLKGGRSGGAARSGKRAQKRPGVERIEPVRFVQLSQALVDDRFELELGTGRRLRIPCAFDAAALGRLLAVLK